MRRGPSAAAHLTLAVVQFDSPGRWRWVLRTADGRFLADHDVSVDPRSREFEAFSDLDRYLRWTVAPDDRAEQETELVRWIGRWVGDYILGDVGTSLLAHGQPVAVLVELPRVARVIASYPLACAIVAGRALTVSGVTFVFHLADSPVQRGRQPAPEVRDRLRVLALFSAPVGLNALDLRQERRALERDFRELAAINTSAVDVRILQYGVTRKRLREVLREAEGWDVIHISGHGDRALLVLEDERGEHDLVSPGELVGLLGPAAPRLRLITLSACRSASRSLVEQRCLLNLPVSVGEALVSDSGCDQAPTEGDDDSAAESMMALRLAAQLGCAVLGMRYPVIDEFAACFSRKLYELWIGRGHVLPHAVSMALEEAGDEVPDASFTAIAPATPALFGESALNLRLTAPPGEPAGFAELTRLSEFEAQPTHFVGRVAIMAGANAMLAPRSGLTGAYFSGMAGVGKTACVLELAHLHQDNFVHCAWYKATCQRRLKTVLAHIP